MVIVIDKDDGRLQNPTTLLPRVLRWSTKLIDAIYQAYCIEFARS